MARPQAVRGLPVRRVNWSNGEWLPYEDRYYLDFVFSDGQALGPADDFNRKDFTIALDAKNRPLMRRRQVIGFSMPAELLRDPIGKGSFDAPLWLSRPVELPLGKAALIKLADFNAFSFNLGAAHIVDKADAIVLHESRTSGSPEAAGVTAVLMPEDTTIVVRQEYRPATQDTDFTLQYRPDSPDGILIEPKLAGPRPKRDDYGDYGDFEGGGSDRSPLRPIVPTQSGEAVAELPLEEVFEEIRPAKLRVAGD